MSATSPSRIRRWKRVEYDRMIECGIFQPGEHLELIDGLLLVKEPQSAAHAAGIRRVVQALRQAFAGAGWQVDAQMPLALDADSEPEPDVSVVPSAPDLYESGHPAEPILVVEVALTRLAFDRRRKGGLYARARVPEYWIVNLVDRVVEVRRAPRRSRAARHGWAYGDVQVFGPEAAIAPVAAPATIVRVADLLPRPRP